MKPLIDFLEFIHKVKTPGPWIFVIFCAVYLDWYALQKAGLSFSELITEPALIQTWAGEKWLLRLTVCVATFSFVWFIGLSLIIIPLLNWVIFEIKLRAPQFSQDGRDYPSVEKGYVYLPIAREYAIFHQNRLLLESCDAERQRLEDIAALKRCCIGIALFSIMAWLSSTSPHPSLLDHLYQWLGQVTIWKQCSFFITAVIVLLHVYSFFENNPFDNYIYLPELAHEIKR